MFPPPGPAPSGSVDGDVLTTLRARVRSDLTAAMKARRIVDVSALRSLLAALDDAQAVPAPAHVPASSLAGEHVAGAAVGVGSTEVARLELSAAEIGLVVAGQIEERQAAADTFAAVDQADAAQRLRAEAEVIARYRPTG